MIAPTTAQNTRKRTRSRSEASKTASARSKGPSSKAKVTSKAAIRLQERFKNLADREIAFIDNDAFRKRTATKTILGSSLDLEFVGELNLKSGVKMPSHMARLCEAPLLTGDEEKTFFRRMNFALYRADKLRSKLPLRRPNSEKMDEVEALLDEATAIKNRIVAANIRLVISIVKQLTSTPTAFEDMLSDGLLAMMRAVEKFNFDLGFRFSTYATMVIRRQLYRSMKNDHRDRTRFPNGESSLLSEHAQQEIEPRIGYNSWLQLNDALEGMIEKLDDRERLIIRARFGFDTDGKKQTLQSLAKEFGVCKERVRQLEKRAMTKLRTYADGSNLESLVEPEFASDCS